MHVLQARIDNEPGASSVKLADSLGAAAAVIERSAARAEREAGEPGASNTERAADEGDAPTAAELGVHSRQLDLSNVSMRRLTELMFATGGRAAGIVRACGDGYELDLTMLGPHWGMLLPAAVIEVLEPAPEVRHHASSCSLCPLPIALTCRATRAIQASCCIQGGFAQPCGRHAVTVGLAPDKLISEPATRVTRHSVP